METARPRPLGRRMSSNDMSDSVGEEHSLMTFHRDPGGGCTLRGAKANGFFGRLLDNAVETRLMIVPAGILRPFAKWDIPCGRDALWIFSTDGPGGKGIDAGGAFSDREGNEFGPRERLR